MPKKRVKRSSTHKPRAKAARRRGKGPEETAFVRSLVVHGQAVAVPPGGKLPAGATHELVTDDAGEVRVIRKRFSAR